MGKPKTSEYYYNSDEYKEKLEELELRKGKILAEKRLEAKEKEKEVKSEKAKLKKIFTKERCGEENMHFVLALIDRASFLRVELNHIEKDLREEGMMDFFTQGVQTLWREHPLSKIHVQHSKSYRETIKQLESYGKTEAKSDSNKDNPLGMLLQKGNKAREKYDR